MPWKIEWALPLPDVVSTGMVLLLLWNIWKARNAMVFDNQDLPPAEILRRTTRDMDLWSCRYKKTSPFLLAWRDYLLARC